MAIYLNTYETCQVYGGPEEGGWWFEAGEPVQSVFYADQELEQFLDATSIEQRQDILHRATAAYTKGKPPTPKDTGYGGYTFALGSDEPSTYQEDNSFSSCFEENYAHPYPQTRPRYE